MNIKCPKCDYVRSMNDGNSQESCPRCGVLYKKVKSRKVALGSARSNQENGILNRLDDCYPPDSFIANIFYVLAIIIFGGGIVMSIYYLFDDGFRFSLRLYLALIWFFSCLVSSFFAVASGRFFQYLKGIFMNTSNFYVSNKNDPFGGSKID